MNFLLYILNVASSASQSVLGKVYTKKHTNLTVFNISKVIGGGGIFLIASLIAGEALHLPTVLYSALHGVFSCIAMYCGLIALGSGPIALTSITASLSFIIPTLFGIFVLKESVGAIVLAGIALLLISIFLINFKKEGGITAKWTFFSLSTMVANGICSVIQKLHQIEYPTLFRSEFTAVSFCSAGIIMVMISLVSRQRGYDKFKLSVQGVLAGITNAVANYIVLYLAATENSTVLFPVISVANVIAIWIIGRLIFKEKLKVLQLCGIALGVISILLINIK